MVIDLTLGRVRIRVDGIPAPRFTKVEGLVYYIPHKHIVYVVYIYILYSQRSCQVRLTVSSLGERGLSNL